MSQLGRALFRLSLEPHDFEHRKTQLGDEIQDLFFFKVNPPAVGCLILGILIPAQ